MTSTSCNEIARELLDQCLAGRPPAELPPALVEEPEGQALFGILVEGLADRFEPRLCDVYARLFSQAVAQVSETVDPVALTARYERVRRPRPISGEPHRVFVLSRVTLGADVAVTSVLLAAAKPSGDKLRHQLPGLMDSFMQWCESAREDFQLGRPIDAQLETRRQRVGITQAQGVWRAMNRGNPEGLKANGYVEDPTQGDAEPVRLELEMVPEWAPGRSMKWPNPSKMKLALPA